jgi:hypothetical protein
MVCSARSRSFLYEIDRQWMAKFRIRVALNVFCFASIICAVITLTRVSKYQPNAYKNSNTVLYYLPAVSKQALPGQTLLWETVANSMICSR